MLNKWPSLSANKQSEQWKGLSVHQSIMLSRWLVRKAEARSDLTQLLAQLRPETKLLCTCVCFVQQREFKMRTFSIFLHHWAPSFFGELTFKSL